MCANHPPLKYCTAIGRHNMARIPVILVSTSHGHCNAVVSEPDPWPRCSVAETAHLSRDMNLPIKSGIPFSQSRQIKFLFLTFDN